MENDRQGRAVHARSSRDLVFDLMDNNIAPRCYAWEKDGNVTAVLHTGPIDSPVKAVRASILAALEK
jgi:hypothetical protein